MASLTLGFGSHGSAAQKYQKSTPRLIFFHIQLKSGSYPSPACKSRSDAGLLIESSRDRGRKGIVAFFLEHFFDGEMYCFFCFRVRQLCVWTAVTSTRDIMYVHTMYDGGNCYLFLLNLFVERGV
jgi:hypothetical protein